MFLSVDVSREGEREDHGKRVQIQKFFGLGDISDKKRVLNNKC